MGELIVVTGPPGAGKSTVARMLAARFETSALVAGDDFFAFLARGAIAPWLPAAHAQNDVVIRAAAAATGHFAAGGYTVVYDGIVGPWFLPTFTAGTGLPGLDYLVLLPPLRTCLDRVATRDGHGFTDAEATRHIYGDFAEAEVDPRHVLVDPPEDPASTVQEILRRLEGPTLRYDRDRTDGLRLRS